MSVEKQLKSQEYRGESRFEGIGDEIVTGQVECKILLDFRCKRGAGTGHGPWSSPKVSQVEMDVFR